RKVQLTIPIDLRARLSEDRRPRLRLHGSRRASPFAGDDAVSLRDEHGQRGADRFRSTAQQPDRVGIGRSVVDRAARAQRIALRLDRRDQVGVRCRARSRSREDGGGGQKMKRWMAVATLVFTACAASGPPAQANDREWNLITADYQWLETLR